MNWKKAGFIILVSTLFLSAKAQDSTAIEIKKKEPLHLFTFRDPHSPKKASIYAAVLPGLGQIYNRKYWKVPIVYATLGAATYSMVYFRGEMRKLNSQFTAAYKLNPDTSLNLNLIAERDNNRRYRDFSILAMTAIYALQIIDATVDAHFYKFNIDQNLEVKMNPSTSNFFQIAYTF